MQLYTSIHQTHFHEGIYLGMHTYSILKVHNYLRLGTYNTAVYCSLWYNLTILTTLQLEGRDIITS